MYSLHIYIVWFTEYVMHGNKVDFFKAYFMFLILSFD